MTSRNHHTNDNCLHHKGKQGQARMVSAKRVTVDESGSKVFVEFCKGCETSGSLTIDACNLPIGSAVYIFERGE